METRCANTQSPRSASLLSGNGRGRLIAHAQFKIVDRAPFPATVARQKIKTLLDDADAGNSRQTVDSLWRCSRGTGTSSMRN